MENGIFLKLMGALISLSLAGMGKLTWDRMDRMETYLDKQVAANTRQLEQIDARLRNIELDMRELKAWKAAGK